MKKKRNCLRTNNNKKYNKTIIKAKGFFKKRDVLTKQIKNYTL